MEAGLARLARQPSKRDEFLLCFYEKMSSRLPGQFCYIDIVLIVVKNVLQRYLLTINFHPGNRASLLVSVYMEKFSSRYF
jgi:hypothetical protein